MLNTRGPDSIIISLRWVMGDVVAIEIIPLIVAGAASCSSLSALEYMRAGVQCR